VPISVVTQGAPDSDNDGVPDTLDLCPTTAGTNFFGCPIPNFNEFSLVSPNLTTVNLSNVPNLFVGVSNLGNINYTGQNIPLIRRVSTTYSAVDLNSAIDILLKKISVNVTSAPELDKPALLTFYQVDSTKPVLRKNFNGCKDCRIVSYNKGTGILVVSVPGFSSYEVVEANPIINTQVFDIFTNVSTYNYLEIPGFEIGSSRYGRISFLENISLLYEYGNNYTQLDFNSALNISNNRIEINSSLMPPLNKSALLYMYNVTLNSPIILKNGVLWYHIYE
jgi:hypothetical protein